MSHRLIILLLLTGCADLLSLGWDSDNSSTQFCSSSNPCPPSERCSFGTCTDLVQEFREVAISVRLGDTVQQFPKVDLSQSTEHNLALNHERSVSGRVQTHEDKGIEATVLARLRTPIDGHPVRRSTTTDNDGNFRFTLTNGGTWDLEVYPSSDQIPVPPVTEMRQIFDDRNEESSRVIITLPSDTDYPVYTGQFVDENSFELTTFHAQPNTQDNGLQLSVVDETGRVVGRATTIDRNGQFSFRVHPSTQRVRLLVRGSSWTHPSALTTALDLTPDATDLGPVALPLQIERNMVLIAASDGNASLPINGEIRVRPLAAEGLVTFRVALNAAEPTSLNLPTGSYEIDLLPESATGFAPSTGILTEVQVGSTASIQITLKPLIRLSGTLVTPDGSPAANARIVCDQKHGLSEALTDENGAFELLVQRGSSWITAIPAPPLPRVLLNLSIDGPQSLDMVIDEGVMLTGSMMRAESSETQGNALITVLAPWQTYEGAAVILGESVVNSDGMYSVALPPF